MWLIDDLKGINLISVILIVGAKTFQGFLKGLPKGFHTISFTTTPLKKKRNSDYCGLCTIISKARHYWSLFAKSFFTFLHYHKVSFAQGQSGSRLNARRIKSSRKVDEKNPIKYQKDFLAPFFSRNITCYTTPTILGWMLCGMLLAVDPEGKELHLFVNYL